MARNKAAVLFAYFWVTIGLVSVYYALTYGFFHSGIPQAGFFPAIAGIILIILGVINTASLHRRRPETPSKEENRLKVALIILAMGFYVALFNTIGFVLVTPVTVFVILRIIQARSIMFLLVVSVTTTVLLYLIFHTFLKIQFPSGLILEFIK